MLAQRARLLRGILAVVVTSVLAAGPVAGQGGGAAPAGDEMASASSTFLGIGTGLGLGSMSVGGRGDYATGLLLSAHVALGRTRSSAWVLELSGQAFKVPSPAIDEEYRAVTVLLKRSFGSQVMVSPALGFDFRSWSGPERVESGDTGLTLGLGIGVPIPLSASFILLPEVAAQTSLIELEGGVSGRLFSFRVSVVKGW